MCNESMKKAGSDQADVVCDVVSKGPCGALRHMPYGDCLDNLSSPGLRHQAAFK
jgi:hypothetical protein